MLQNVYNLEFPPHVNELNIGGYVFRRSSDYSDAFGKMQHLVNSSGSEHKTVVQTGSHQITATVEIPDVEQQAVLMWADQEPKRILDVLLLLSIFTGRNVFVKNWEEDEGVAILQDHRQHHFGGELILSLPTESRWRHRHEGTLHTEKEIQGKPLWDYDQLNIGFEKGLNNVLDLISSKDWQKTYEGGYFLFLYRQAIQRQILETSFIVSWSIWEHLFTLHNKNWLDESSIQKMGGKEKITFVYNKYLGSPSQVSSEIEPLAKARNRIIHYGIKPTGTDNDSMERFVRMTERLMAIILGLRPSYVLDGVERLRKTLNGRL